MGNLFEKNFCFILPLFKILQIKKGILLDKIIDYKIELIITLPETMLLLISTPL